MYARVSGSHHLHSRCYRGGIFTFSIQNICSFSLSCVPSTHRLQFLTLPKSHSPITQNHPFYFGGDFGKTLDIQPFHFKISPKNHLFSQFYAPKTLKHLDFTHFYRSHPIFPIFTSLTPLFLHLNLPLFISTKHQFSHILHGFLLY